MDVERKKVLEENRTIIEELLIPSTILGRLISHGVHFDADVENKIQSHCDSGEHKRACSLLLSNLIESSGPNCFQAFLQSLREQNYERLVDVLEGNKPPADYQQFIRMIKLFSKNVEEIVDVDNILIECEAVDLIQTRDREHVQRVKINKGNSNAVRTLLSYIYRYKNEWFISFIKILMKRNYSDVVQLILGEPNYDSLLRSLGCPTNDGELRSQEDESDLGTLEDTFRDLNLKFDGAEDFAAATNAFFDNPICEIVPDVGLPPDKDSGSSAVGSEEATLYSRVSRTSLTSGSTGCNKVELYSYQKELAGPALSGKNTIICAPTGSGKTLTAAFIARRMYDACKKESFPFRCLFIVPIRNLVTQQCGEFRKLFQDNIQIVRTLSDDEILRDSISDTDAILFITAQILVNSLNQGDVSIKDFNLFVMDECHHTTRDHPFNQIMRFYLKEKVTDPGVRLPQVLGMTASLGVGKKEALKHYIHVCANLDCSKISHVRQNTEELLQHNPKPRENQLISVLPRQHSAFQEEVEYLMQRVEESDPMLGRPVGKETKGTQAYESTVMQLKIQAEKSATLTDVVSACSFLRVLNDTLLYFKEFRADDAMKFLEENMPACVKGANTIYELSILSLYEEKMSQMQAAVRGDINPMLRELTVLLERLLSASDNPKGLILTRRKLGVEWLCNILASHFKHRQRVGFLIGKGVDGLTDARQNDVIEEFRKKDGISLLVATDVAQEGLDIPRCNFVVRYNFVSNEIGSVQSRGRARAKESECYLLVLRGSLDEKREYENMIKEHRMMEALLEIDKLDDLEEKIRTEQNKLIDEMLRPKPQPSSTVSDGFRIFCKKCKTYLCRAESIRRKGSHYICIDPWFPERTTRRNVSAGTRQFRDDQHVGQSVCKGLVECGGPCESPIGPIIRYTNSKREIGYLLGKDNLVYQDEVLEIQGKFEQLKNWKKVPFTISEESLRD